MWNVSSRSGVATLRTAIHLLLTRLYNIIIIIIIITDIFRVAETMKTIARTTGNSDSSKIMVLSLEFYPNSGLREKFHNGRSSVASCFALYNPHRSVISYTAYN